MKATTRRRTKPRTKKGRNPGWAMVRRRIQDARAFASSIKVHKGTVAAGLAEELSPGLREGQTLPDYALTLELLASRVKGALAELTEVHSRYVSQTAVGNRLSTECDRITAREVYPQAVDLRRLIDAVFGKRKGAAIHGFHGRIPTWRDGLHEQLGTTLYLLESRQDKMPEPAVAGFVPQTEVWIRQVRSLIDRLGEHLSKLENADQLREGLCHGRNRAIETFDRVLAESRDAAAALFTLAGCDPRLIRNLRPYYQRRGLRHWARQAREKRRQARASAVTAAAGGDPVVGGERGGWVFSGPADAVSWALPRRNRLLDAVSRTFSRRR